MLTQPVVCTEENTPTRHDGPECEFVGQEYEGVWWAAWRGSGVIMPAEAFVASIVEHHESVVEDASDEYGEARLRVFAIDSGVRADGQQRHVAFLTALVERLPGHPGEGPLRIAIATFWEFHDGSWMMPGTINTSNAVEEFLDPPDWVLAGEFPNWERFEPTP